ncbi:MAG TPA: ABC transporter substrate-binding protein [Thermoanaerobaculia bacterium]|nr:ABC transporter substrate-binding protein [Thermoanaerobaculia bacterium]
MRRRVLTALGVLLLAASFCARRSAPAPGEARLRDTMQRHLDGDPPTLDPTVTNEDFGIRVEDLIFRPLVGFDRQRRFVPALAKSWAVSSDGLTYDFRLDPIAHWEDGSPVTSADVAFTIERVRNPKVPAVQWHWGFEDLARVETPDPQSILVRFQHPLADRLFAFSLPIVSAAAFGKDPGAMARHPFGTGPYRLESWTPNQKISLVRRADAPSSQFPIARVDFLPIPDNATRFRAGSRGELDEFKVTRDQSAVARRDPDFLAHNVLLKVPQFLTVMVVYNCRNPLLSDRRVRLALARTWPRQMTALQLYPPDGARLVSGPYPAGAAENAPDVKIPEEDPAAAGRLLDEAGWKLGSDGWRVRGGKRASIEILYAAGTPIYANLAQILKEGYAKVGVELTLRALDWAAYSERLAAGDFEIAPYANTFWPPHLDQYLYFHSSQVPPQGENIGFYRSAEADRAIEVARAETDETRRLELFRQVHRVLAADPPADFLYTADQYWGISKSLADVAVSEVGLFHFLPGPLAWKRIAPPK